MAAISASLKESLEHLPNKPGTYLFRDSLGKLLYVGKAASLRSRARSHFSSSPKPSPWNALMISRVASVEWVVTDSELEALILENNLIKKHKPLFNIRLSDDKTYPYIRLTLEERFPRITVVRRIEGKGSRYFGPYGDAGSMRRTLKIIRKVFGLRTCKTMPPPEKGPCLDYHIGRCCGPCIGEVSEERYDEMVKETILFLEGRSESFLERLRGRMEQYAEEFNFEMAARLRDQIFAIESALEHQKVASPSGEDLDIIAVASDDGLACVQVFSVREGKMSSRDHFELKGAQDKSPSEILGGFLQQRYSLGQLVPKRILVQMEPEEREIVEEWLSNLRGSKVSISVPRKGEKRALLEMAVKNASLALQSVLQSSRVRQERDERLLCLLQDHFSLPRLPRRVEAYDVSTVQGVHTVGSMVVFEDGVPNKKAYRMFKIQNPEAFRDDYAALREVLSRRFSRVRVSDERFGSLPDLILIDGGKGQLKSAESALKEAGLSISCISLAKNFNRIYTSSSPKPLYFPTEPELLHFFQRVRDEAHRFALSYHVRLRAKAQTRSILEEIPRVGAVRRKKLLRHFGSLARLKEATEEEIRAVPGIDARTASVIYAFMKALEKRGDKNE